MAQMKLRPVTSREGAGLGISLSSPERNSKFSASAVFSQDIIDPVVILAARSRVAPATVRAQLAAWRIGGAHG